MLGSAQSRIGGERCGGSGRSDGLLELLGSTDEPLGALDPLTRASLQEDLRRLFADLGKTVVLVTHDLGEAAFLAQRIVLLRDGVVAQEGTIADLALRPADDFVARFVHAHRTLQLPVEGDR